MHIYFTYIFIGAKNVHFRPLYGEITAKNYPFSLKKHRKMLQFFVMSLTMFHTWELELSFFMNLINAASSKTVNSGVA